MSAHAAATGGHGDHHGHADHINAPLRTVLRERLIQLGTMRIELRLIVGFAIAQLIVAGILLALKDAEGGAFSPSLFAFPADEGNGLELISAAAFTIGVLITSAAWAYALAGAFRAGVVIRVVVLAIFAWAFVIERDSLVGLGTAPTVICLLLMGLVAALAIGTWFPERRLHRARLEGHPIDPGHWQWARTAMVPLLFLAVGGLYLTVFLASRAVDAANPGASLDNTQLSNFSNDVFDQVNSLQYLLIPLLVLAGSDFGEWGNLAVARAARRVRTMVPAAVFALIALVAAGAIAYDGVTTANGPDGGGAVEELILAGVVTVVAIGLYLLAKPRGGWGTSVPFLAIAVVAIADTASGFITEKLQTDSPHLDDYILIASAALWVVAGLISLVALVAGRGRFGPGLTAGLVFVVLIGAVDLLGSVWVLGNFDNAPLGITSDNAPYLGPEGIRAAAAILTGVVVLVAAARRRLREWLVPIALMLGATVTIELLSYIDLLYANKGKLEEVPPVGGFALGGTIILLAALLWDLAVSGEAITNVEGRWFPRDTRVLMFVGYILLISSAVLMFASLHSESGKLLESSFDPESWVKQGILFLGIPLVLTLLIAGLHRWRASGEQVDPAPHATHGDILAEAH